MRTFKDNEAREWFVRVDVAAVKRVRDLLQVNLLDVLGGDLVERLRRDPVLLCDVLYVLCQPQANERQLADVDFGRAMAGDAIASATDALLEELVSFFPTAERTVLGRLLQSSERVREKAYALATARSDVLEAEALAKLEAALSTRGGSVGNSPGSSGSTPAP